MTIDSIFAEEIKDSRGKPTLKVTVTSGDNTGSFEVPSGASTGVHEAHELRDEDGRGVQTAIENVNNIIGPALHGVPVTSQLVIDQILTELDGTKNKSNLGGNALIGVSIACAKAAARAHGIEVFEYLRTLLPIAPSQTVPYLYINLINGGKHANNGLAFQEYHIVPQTQDAGLAIEIGNKVQDTLKEILVEKFGDTTLAIGDEGGYAPQINDIEVPLELLQQAFTKNNFEVEVRFALDVAASSFFENGKYAVGDTQITAQELGTIYDTLIKKYNLLSIEDPFEEESFSDFAKLIDRNPTLLSVGDDITVTNTERIIEAVEKKSVNAMIIKPNQIGTLSETLDAMKCARENGLKLIISHRSGETMDDFIADLAYAFGCFGLKAGSPQKAERMVKYARLEKISKS